MITKERDDTALLACDVAVPVQGAGVRACLDSISLAELARLYQGGVRRLVTCRGDCGACPRGTTQAFDTACRELAWLIDDRGLAALEREDVAPAQWLEERERSARLSRRGFLMALRPAGGQDKTSGRGPDRLAAATILTGGASDDAQLNPITPRIDVELCTACDACSRICPHEAISLEAPEDAPPAYRIEPPRCTGCRMCIDVCDVSAVSLVCWQRSSARRVELDQAQCVSCGNVFRRQHRHEATSQLCRICAATGHNAKLFQVLE
jgi:ferredoxin